VKFQGKQIYSHFLFLKRRVRLDSQATIDLSGDGINLYLHEQDSTPTDEDRRQCARCSWGSTRLNGWLGGSLCRLYWTDERKSNNKICPRKWHGLKTRLSEGTGRFYIQSTGSLSLSLGWMGKFGFLMLKLARCTLGLWNNQSKNALCKDVTFTNGLQPETKDFFNIHFHIRKSKHVSRLRTYILVHTYTTFYLNKSWWCLHRRRNIYSVRSQSVWFFAEKGFLSIDSAHKQQ